MAIDIDPAGTFKIPMGKDGKGPTFIFRTVTRRDAKQLNAALMKLQGISDGSGIDVAEAAMDEITERVMDQLVDWKNVRDYRGAVIRFDPKKLDAVLSEGDLAELAAQLRVASFLRPDEKKVSGSRAQSRRESSAKGVRRGTAKR